MARGLVLCDAEAVDPRTGNVNLVGCFDRITAPTVPCVGRAFSAVALLSGGHGDARLRVAVDRPDTGDRIFRRDHRMRFDDRLRARWCRFEVSQCVFPSATWYSVVLFANDEWLAETRLSVGPPLKS